MNPLTALLAQTTAPVTQSAAPAPNTLPPVAPGGHSFWMPPQASANAPAVDATFYFILWVSTFFFILIVALLVWFVIRYRQRQPGQEAPFHITHNTPLELTWSIIPLILVVAMFWLGFRGFLDLMNPPANAMDIRVLAQKWTWSFTYPNGHVDTELHVPVNTPVRLILESNDVIHSLFIPAFRIKRDAVPGRYNKVWFEATQAGEYLLLCTEFCGTKHSDMLARVVVHEPGMYGKWLEEASDLFRTRKPAEVGALLVQRRCSGCHSVDGTANIGPTFKNVYEHEVQLEDGSTVLIDDNYIRESILLPQAKIVKGFGREMPSFKGQLKDREITAIIDYIREISGKAPAAPEPDPSGEPKPGEGSTKPAEAAPEASEASAQVKE